MKLNQTTDPNVLKTTLIENYNRLLDKILDKEIDDLSVFELQMLKLVASSSISVLRAKGKSNLQILGTHQKVSSPENQIKKIEKTKRALTQFTDEELEALGLKRV